LNRSRSGVLVPVLLEGGWARPLVGPPVLLAASVVVRPILVVSADGGGGSEDMNEESDDKIDARQRKHSPVPK
jgi:hypothetical protein